WKMEFDFGEDARKDEGNGEPVDFSGQQRLGACPKCQGAVYEHGSNYICENTVASPSSCDFKSGKIILQQPVPAEQMVQLLETGKTALLENFISNRTKRKFKAFLSWNAKEGKVAFEFEPRAPRAAGKTAKGADAEVNAAGEAAAGAIGSASGAAAKPAA